MEPDGFENPDVLFERLHQDWSKFPGSLEVDGWRAFFDRICRDTTDPVVPIALLYDCTALIEFCNEPLHKHLALPLVDWFEKDEWIPFILNSSQRRAKHASLLRLRQMIKDSADLDHAGFEKWAERDFNRLYCDWSELQSTTKLGGCAMREDWLTMFGLVRTQAGYNHSEPMHALLLPDNYAPIYAFLNGQPKAFALAYLDWWMSQLQTSRCCDTGSARNRLIQDRHGLKGGLALEIREAERAEHDKRVRPRRQVLLDHCLPDWLAMPSAPPKETWSDWVDAICDRSTTLWPTHSILILEDHVVVANFLFAQARELSLALCEWLRSSHTLPWAPKKIDAYSQELIDFKLRQIDYWHEMITSPFFPIIGPLMKSIPPRYWTVEKKHVWTPRFVVTVCDAKWHLEFTYDLRRIQLTMVDGLINGPFGRQTCAEFLQSLLTK